MAYLNEIEDEINLADLFRAVKKHLRSIVKVCIVATLLMGLITYFLIPKKYQSEVAFYIHESNSSGMLSTLSSQLGALGGFLPGGIGGGTNADLCSDIILARQFLKRVLKAEGQPHEPEDIKKFKKTIEVKKNKSGVVTIAVLAKNPTLAYRLMRQIFEQYQDVIENEIYRTNNTNRLFIEGQLAKSEARLEQVEQNILAHQQLNGILILPDQASEAIEYITELEKNKMQVTIGLEEARHRLREAEAVLAKNESSVKESVRSLVNPMLQRYKVNLSEIEVRLAQARETLTDQHPTVKSLLAQRTELIAKMEEEEEAISSPEVAGEYVRCLVQIAGLEARRDSLGKVYNEKQAQLDKLPKELMQYGQLLREQKVTEQIYIFLVSQLEQARIAEAKENNVEIQVIDAPVIPHKKHSPSTLINMALIGFLTCFFGLAGAIYKERKNVFAKGTTVEI